MAGFESPNYTQVPNDLFDVHLATMKEAELRVVLAIVRQTIGYHRMHVRYSLSKLAAMTGMSKSGVLNGCEAAIKDGYLTKEESDGGVTTWILNVAPTAPPDQSTKCTSQLSGPPTPELVNEVDRGSQLSGHPSTKERTKETEPKKSVAAAPPFSPPPSVQKAVARGKELMALRQPYVDAYCAATGDRVDGFSENLTDERRKVLLLLDEARKDGVSAEDVRLLLRWRLSDTAWQPYGAASDLKRVLSMYAVWVQKGKPHIWEVAKPTWQKQTRRGQPAAEMTDADVYRQLREAGFTGIVEPPS